MLFLPQKVEMHQNVFAEEAERSGSFNPTAKFCVRVINAQHWTCFTVNLLCQLYADCVGNELWYI